MESEHTAPKESTQRFFAYLFLGIFYTMALMVPRVATASVTEWLKPQSTDPKALGDWYTFSQLTSTWMPYKLKDGVALDDPDYVVYAPKDNFRLLGEGQFSQKDKTFDWRMIEGERWITQGREDIGKAGLSNKEMSDRIAAFPKNMQYVFAAYSPETTTLHVEVQKIEKLPNGKIEIRNADFTPWHGEHWKRGQKYLTPAERDLDPFRAGYNPFENFKGADVSDKVFHNVSWAAAKVIVGHAQRYYDAPISFVAVTSSRFTQKVTTSSGLFSSTVTVTVKGYAKPKWYVGTPIELQPTGEMGALCVGPGSTDSTCDAPQHIAHAGVTFMPWDGGNMPSPEDLVYKWTQSTTSFTILFFSVILAILTWGVALVAMAAAGVASVGVVAGIEIGAGTLGVIAGATYALAFTVFHGGGGLLDAQAGFFGSVGSGVLKPPSADTGASKHTKNLAKAIQQNHIDPSYGYGLTGTTELYKGACPEGYTVKQCTDASLDPGTMWRPDTYAEYNTVLDLRERFAKCKELGYTGADLNKCAAPKEGEWGDAATMPAP